MNQRRVPNPVSQWSSIDKHYDAAVSQRLKTKEDFMSVSLLYDGLSLGKRRI